MATWEMRLLCNTVARPLIYNKVFLQWQEKSTATIQPQELFRSLIRHYNNAILDGEKQDAINIFLGHFRPEAGKLALWQMNSDNHLQIRKAGDDPTNDLRLSFKRSFSAGNMREQIGTAGASSQVACQTNPNTKRGSTISEAELKKCLANDCVFSDVRRDDTDPALLCRLYSSMYKSTDSSQHPNEFADADWLSSSGNSCEEDMQERQLVTTGGSNNSNFSSNSNSNLKGSGLLPETHVKSEDSYRHNDYFQDFSPMFMKPKSLYSKPWGEMTF